MNSRVIASSVVLTLCWLVRPAAAQQPAATAWRLIFAVDSAGHTTNGDKAQLLTAVRAGRPVRVGWRVSWRTADGASGTLEHVAAASFLTIHHGEVFAQTAPILGQRPSAHAPDVALRTEGDQLWYALLDTTGRMLSYFTGTSPAQTTRVATFWYSESS